MTREEKILFRIKKEDIGVEIGPSYNPIAEKKKGYKVHIIDYLDKKGLIQKYTDEQVNLDKIEEVDYIWNGGSYAELTEKRNYYQWVIASHVIEHTPDIIGFIKQCEELLTPDGILSLVIPDGRFCFDNLRTISSISSVIDAGLAQRKIHSPGKVFEHHANIITKNEHIVWNDGDEGPNNFRHHVTFAKAAMNLALKQDKYIDVHSWVFTPSSFRLIIADLNFLGLINLKEDVFFETVGHEFYMTLSFKGEGLKKSRLEMLENIKYEALKSIPSTTDKITSSPVEKKLTLADNRPLPLHAYQAYTQKIIVKETMTLSRMGLRFGNYYSDDKNFVYELNIFLKDANENNKTAQVIRSKLKDNELVYFEVTPISLNTGKYELTILQTTNYPLALWSNNGDFAII